MTDGSNSDVVCYDARDGVAVVTMNRPEYRNAQNAKMTAALDAAFMRAVRDDAVAAIVLAGAGPHFSAGHDIGTPDRDIHKSFPRTATTWWEHEGRPNSEAAFVREAELYVGMCRRWRALPKPTIAMVHGACIAGGLMLAWICDLIIAADDAFFADPVLAMGIPGVEYFAHPHVMAPRLAKEFLFLGEKMPARRAYEIGMVNRVVPRDELAAFTFDLAKRIGKKPRFALALAKQIINQAEDRMGLQTTIDAVYGYHHFAHAHNELNADDYLAGQNAKTMAESLK